MIIEIVNRFIFIKENVDSIYRIEGESSFLIFSLTNRSKKKNKKCMKNN